MDTDTHIIYNKNRNVINESKEIVFENHVWIGCGALILKGPVFFLITLLQLIVSLPQKHMKRIQ